MFTFVPRESDCALCLYQTPAARLVLRRFSFQLHRPIDIMSFAGLSGDMFSCHANS